MAAALKELGPEGGQALLLRLAESLDGATVSTSFSGVDSPGTALEIICLHLETTLNIERPVVKHLSAIEWYAESARELLCHPSRPSCLFRNISNFYEPSVKTVIDAARARNEKVGFETLLPAITSNKAMRSFAHCTVHGKECQIIAADHHTAGSPCTDFSKQGLQEGVDGPTMEFFMAWCGLRRLLQEPTITHENVFGMPEFLLTRTLGDLYNIETVACFNKDHGFPDNRGRNVRQLTHKRKVAKIIQPFEVVNAMFTRVCKMKWPDVLCGDSSYEDEEAQQEAQQETLCTD